MPKHQSDNSGDWGSFYKALISGGALAAIRSDPARVSGMMTIGPLASPPDTAFLSAKIPEQPTDPQVLVHCLWDFLEAITDTKHSLCLTAALRVKDLGHDSFPDLHTGLAPHSQQILHEQLIALLCSALLTVKIISLAYHVKADLLSNDTANKQGLLDSDFSDTVRADLLKPMRPSTPSSIQTLSNALTSITWMIKRRYCAIAASTASSGLSFEETVLPGNKSACQEPVSQLSEHAQVPLQPIVRIHAESTWNQQLTLSCYMSSIWQFCCAKVSRSPKPLLKCLSVANSWRRCSWTQT